MAVNPTIVRTKPKLSDYLFDQDKTKFKLNKKASRPWIINNANDKHKMKNVLDDNLVTDFENIVSIHRGADPNLFLGKEKRKEKGPGQTNHLSYDQGNINKTQKENENETMHNKFHKNTKASQFGRKLERVDNMNTSRHHSRNSKHSPQSQRKYQNSTKSRNEIEIEQEEDTEEDRLKKQLLERDIELEYQQQVNKMFNNQQSAHMFHQMNQICGNREFHQNQNHFGYPPLYLQGPQGLYYILVPPPDNYIADYPGSVGDLSDNDSVDECESITESDMSCDKENSEGECLTQYQLRESFANVHHEEDEEYIDYEMQNDEQLTRLVLSIIDE